ncbi:hypothetical protein PYR71_29840 [Rhizobium sp. MC63]|jgi:hypothetical protein|uniref:Lipocalin-like domain-containing protein n=15 Tax=Rhizobium TaxID=379 RepID=A0A1C3Y9Z5_9HYPH|nr:MULTISPECIES: hypothetical protein [Rhizobium]ACE93772.1 hypothetical conserved protein [Rhizobium etli CIAT 652]AJC82137.1 hypothetical protein IE4803_PB00077 [Rhizobium etli bv. phaseoli str. IE4803]EGE58685.1 hypothetical protein RHECNPAF_2890018 [Rhizobium etli CNPAF512]KEC70845.1 hypothetical protein RLPCCGM1_p0619 [Rhizobium leguminosarum bv. phaseoli CCGM1]AAM55016.2 hypothetical conserved protein [Rhizobium etli CFN 42]
MSFTGTWSYRSLINNPDLSVDFNALEFGQGTLVLTELARRKVGGTIGGPGWSLELTGTVRPGDPVELQFTGKGDVAGETWIYSYRGYIVPNWPNGVDQRDAIVGSIVRDVPHSHGVAAAGYVASWYAVRQ